MILSTLSKVGRISWDGRSWDSGRGGSLTPSEVSWVSRITWSGGGGKVAVYFIRWLLGFRDYTEWGVLEQCEIEVLRCGWFCLD